MLKDRTNCFSRLCNVDYVMMGVENSIENIRVKLAFLISQKITLINHDSREKIANTSYFT